MKQQDADPYRRWQYGAVRHETQCVQCVLDFLPPHNLEQPSQCVRAKSGLIQPSCEPKVEQNKGQSFDKPERKYDLQREDLNPPW